MDRGRIYKAEGVILARRNIGEADRILTLFTKEYGKLKVLAKGVRRITSRRAAHLEIFSQVIVLLHQGKIWDIVSEVQPVDAFTNLRNKLDRVSLGYYFCELIDALLPERQEHRDVFGLLRQALQTLNDLHCDNIYYHSEQFALELLRKLGYLARDKTLDPHEIEAYIESIIEKRLRTPKILRQLISGR